MAAFVPANSNPVLDIVTGVTADTTSPVDYTATGALAQAESLVVTIGLWRGGAVASGWIGHGAGAYTNIIVPGGLSGGTTARSETNGRFALNVASTSSISVSETYTSLTNAHGEVMVWNDEGTGATAYFPRRRGMVVNA